MLDRISVWGGKIADQSGTDDYLLRSPCGAPKCARASALVAQPPRQRWHGLAWPITHAIDRKGVLLVDRWVCASLCHCGNYFGGRGFNVIKSQRERPNAIERDIGL